MVLAPQALAAGSAPASVRWRAEGVIEGRPTEFDAEVLGLALAEDVAAERAYDLGEAETPWPEEDA